VHRNDRKGAQDAPRSNWLDRTSRRVKASSLPDTFIY